MPDVPVVVLELADSAVVLRASLWAKDNATAFALKCAVLEGIKLTYDAEGIDIAYPHMQVVKVRMRRSEVWRWTMVSCVVGRSVISCAAVNRNRNSCLLPVRNRKIL